MEVKLNELTNLDEKGPSSSPDQMMETVEQLDEAGTSTLEGQEGHQRRAHAP